MLNNKKMKHPKPIFLVDLLPKIDQKLIELLQNLAQEDWSKQTVAPKWIVKDIAVHLLDGNLRTLSMLRDNYFGTSAPQINAPQDLINYLNDLNADWVKAMKRLSPAVIIDLLKKSGAEYCAYMASLDAYDKAAFSVAWAGEAESLNWFHIAREYTEKWHHQQQIRLAVGKDAELLATQWYRPYLDTSVRALPHHYRNVKGENGDLIKFAFRGVKDKNWYLKYQTNQWVLLTDSHEKPTCEVVIKDKYAWRIFTKGIERKEVIEQSIIIGKQELGLHIFEMIAVMA